MNLDANLAIVGHKTLRLADLMPDKFPSFSPNLYRWMKRHSHFYRDGGTADSVYRVKAGSRSAEIFGEGRLLIGHPLNGHAMDTDFSGSRLLGALANGDRERRYCYTQIVGDLELVEGFWDRYLQVGRCAIDPEHSVYFSSSSERFSVRGDHRTCLWCGHHQTRHVTARIVHDEIWV